MALFRGVLYLLAFWTFPRNGVNGGFRSRPGRLSRRDEAKRPPFRLVVLRREWDEKCRQNSAPPIMSEEKGRRVLFRKFKYKRLQSCLALDRGASNQAEEVMSDTADLHLHPHRHQRCPLHFPDKSVSSQGPLLGHGVPAQSLPHQAARAPILHQDPGLILGHAIDSHHIRVLQGVINPLVVLAFVGVRPRHLSSRLPSLELRESKLLGGVAESVVLRRGGQDCTAVGQLLLARQEVDEEPDKGQIVRMDRLERRISVLADLVDVRKAVEAEQNGRAAREHQLGPQGREGWPGVFAILCTLSQVGQRSALLQIGQA